MRERGCYSTTTLAPHRRPCRPHHPYAVPKTLFQCVCIRRRNCIGQLSPFSKYAPGAAHFPVWNSATIKPTLAGRTGHKTPCFGYADALVGCFVGSTFASWSEA